MRVTQGMLNGFNSLPPTQRNGGRTGTTPATDPTLSPQERLSHMLVNTARFVTNARPRATLLSNAISNLTAINDNRIAVSGNPSTVAIHSFNGRDLANTFVRVGQIAVSQRNQGTTMPADEHNTPPGGTHRFMIEVNGQEHEISFFASTGMSNQEFQNRMASAISNANIGITAAVTTSTIEGELHSQLNLEAVATGAGEDGKPRFTITDISGSAVAFTGVGEIYREGQNARFFVNDGEIQESDSNIIDLGNGLRVRLLEASETPVKITQGPNTQAMQNGIRTMVSHFNSLLETARGNGDDRFTQILIRDLERAARTSNRSLAELGVSVNRNGTLSVDNDRLRESVENGVLERFFGNTNRQSNTFLRRLDRIATNVARNPMRHVSPHAARTPGFNAALNAVQNGNNNNNSSQVSPFDAYFGNDPLEHLLNALS